MQDEQTEYVPEPLTVLELDGRIALASERRARMNVQMREDTKILHELVQRKQLLVNRLEATLAELQKEQDLINSEVQRLLTPEEQHRFVILTLR